MKFNESSRPKEMKTLQLNLILAWIWICLGFISGLGLGLFFQRENWLGGYASLKRRLYRLCHISFFGLGVLNLCFCLTVQTFGVTGDAPAMASWAFLIGAISMPLCCLLMAHFPRALPIFTLPVASLLLGGTLTVVGVAHANPQARTGRTSLYTSTPSQICLDMTEHPRVDHQTINLYETDRTHRDERRARSQP